MVWAHQGVGGAAAAVCTPDSRRAGQVASQHGCCRSPQPTDSASRAPSMVSPAGPSHVASLADSMLTEEAQAVSEELVRAARNWQEEHREWQKRYSQWLAEQSQWDSAFHAAACAAAEGRRSLSSSMRQSTCSSASGVLSGAMKKALFAGRRATSSVCSRAANRTRRGLAPAARRLGRRLKAALARSAPELNQHQQQLQLQQRDEYLLHLQQHRLFKGELLRQPQRSFKDLELLQQQQRLQQQGRQQQRHFLAASQQVQQLQPQQQHAQRQQQEEDAEDDDDEFEEWSQREEEELHEKRDLVSSERAASEPLQASAAIPRSTPLSRRAEELGLTQLEADLQNDDEWEDEEQVLQGLNSSINWIVDVGLNPAARAAAAATLQRREQLLQQQQQQQQQKQKQRELLEAEPSRASSAATCCDSLGISEDAATVHRQRCPLPPLQTHEKPLAQTSRAAVVRYRQKLRFQEVEGAARTPQREESECSLEDCVLHSHEEDTEKALSDTNSSSCCSSSRSSISSAYLEHRLRASRRLHEAAAAAKTRQLALAQRRAEAATREELCYNEVSLDSAL